MNQNRIALPLLFFIALVSVAVVVAFPSMNKSNKNEVTPTPVAAQAPGQITPLAASTTTPGFAKTGVAKERMYEFAGVLGGGFVIIGSYLVAKKKTHL